MKERIQHGLATLVCLFGLVAVGEPARLAVVPVTPGINPTAEILTAALTGDGQVALVERSEIGRLMQEQALSAQNRNTVRLGQMLNADGLLLLELVPQGKVQVLSLRLVSVQTGVALWQGDFAWPLKDDSDWAALVVRQTKSVLPKLRVARTAALPLSILNLRSTTRSPEAHALEEGLTRLLRDRLMREPTVFVLERRKLELLFEENRLFAGGDEAFWNGGYLLDGVIDRDGYAPAQATVDVRLVPPNHGSPIEIHAVGARTNLNALTADLAQKILAAVKHAGAVTTWQPATEATNYLDEAKWALRWGLLREAQSASEASWALGLQNREVAELRVKSWRETGADHAGYAVNTENSVVSYGRWPDAAQFADLLRATDAYEDAWRRFVANEASVDQAWLRLGATLLNDLTDSLRHYYFAPEARAGQEDQIHLAQQQALRLCALILAHPDYANADPGRLIWMAKARGAAFWVETPAEGVAIYREMMERGIWPAVRKRFNNISWFQQESAIQTFTFPASVGEGFSLANPPLAGWKWAERRNWRPAWDHFIAELCAAKDPRVALEGRYLKCASAWSGDDFEAALRDVLDFAWEQREALADAGIESGLLKDLKGIAGPDGPRMKALSTERASRVRHEIWEPFENRMNQAQALRSHATGDGSGKITFEAVKAYLAGRQPYDPEEIWTWRRESWNASQAGELLPLLHDYATHLSNTLTQAEFSSAHTRLKMFEFQLNSVLRRTTHPPGTGAVPHPPVSFGTPPSVVPPHIAGRPMPGANSLASIVATNFVANVRFWTPQPTRLQLTKLAGIFLSTPAFREGRWWVEAFIRMDDPHDSKTNLICAIDPDTLETEYVPTDESAVRLPLINNGELEPRPFEVWNGSIYQIEDGHIDRYELSQKRWQRLPLEVQAPARLSLVQGRLYLTTEDSILALSPDGSTQIIASCRRKPAQTALDEAGNYDAPVLFAGPDRSIRALIGEQIWSMHPGKSDWTVTGQKPAGYSNNTFSEGGVLFAVKSFPATLYRLHTSQAAPELILQQAPRTTFPAIGMPRPGGQTPPTRPLWQAPHGLSFEGMPGCLTESNLLLFAGSVVVQSQGGRPALAAQNGRQGLLLRSPVGNEPWSLAALALELPDSPELRRVLPRLTGMGAFGKTRLYPTPMGLILERHAIPGFWILPWSEVNQALARGLATPAAPHAAMKAQQ